MCLSATADSSLAFTPLTGQANVIGCFLWLRSVRWLGFPRSRGTDITLTFLEVPRKRLPQGASDIVTPPIVPAIDKFCNISLAASRRILSINSSFLIAGSLSRLGSSPQIAPMLNTVAGNMLVDHQKKIYAEFEFQTHA